ncbi:MAG: hypothetical protein ACSLFQ_04960 [Thermoanaerobaculia bacterium]
MSRGLSCPRLLALVAASLLCSAVAAESLPVRRVVVFKNGLGFLTRSGPVAVQNGAATLDEIPPAAYGTLWVGFGDGSAVTEVVAEPVTKASERPAAGVGDLLGANPGAQVTLTLRTGGSISGTIVPPSAKDDAPPGTVMLESGGRFTALSSSDVLSVSFASRPRATIAAQMKFELLRVRTDGRDGKRDLTVSYLTKGIGWTPEYAVEIRPDGTAAIAMRALLVNDSMDLGGSEVLFAVGYPSFAFAEVPTPLDVRRSLADFFQELRRDRTDWNASALANVMTQSVVSPRNMPRRDEGGYDSTAAGVAGEAEQDLFLYSKSGVTLKKGERAAYPILGASAAYRHVFDWEIEDVSSVDPWGHRASAQSSQLVDQVWHSLRLDNAGKLPWTTGPAIVTEKGTPIAQNTLYYTAPGASTLLRLTVAPDVLAEREEWEASRQSGALQRFGYRYDAVTMEGKLDVTNRRREAITLSIRKSLTGTVSSSSDGGKPTKLSTRPSAVNPASRIDWSIPLAAGEQKSVAYKYVVYVRD